MSSVNASAFVKKGRLFIIGVCLSPMGAVPFQHSAKVQGDLPDGPVPVRPTDDMHPALGKALAKAEGPLMFQVEKERIKKAVSELVDRSRLGDQNATAMLISIRQNAENPEYKDRERAKCSYDYAMAYVKKKPNTRETTIAGSFDGPAAGIGAAVAATKNPEQYAATVITHLPTIGTKFGDAIKAASSISQGPAINVHLLTAVRDALPSNNGKSGFLLGVKFSGDKDMLVKQLSKAPKTDDVKKGAQLGYTMAMAQLLQEVRKPNTPIAPFSPAAAWELGE